MQEAKNFTRELFSKQSLRLASLLSGISVVFPVLSLIGWIFGIPLLTKGHPALPAMQPNTAVALVLSAMAILFSRKNTFSTWMSAFLRIAGVTVCLLGILSLSEYLFDWNLGIDTIFLSGMPTTEQPYPGRPSPQTSLNFVLLGAVLLIYNLRFPAIRVGQFLALIMMANAITAMTGYIFSTQQFYGFPIYVPAIGMAIQTALAFIFLGIALLCSFPNEGLMTLAVSDTRAGQMARRILIMGVLAPPIIGVILRLGVAAGWYGVNVQYSLFTIVLLFLILRTTWKTARFSEAEELQAREAFRNLETSNQNLRKVMQERQVFFALIENSLDFIGIADANGKPIYINPAGRKMVGIDPHYPIERTQIPQYYPESQRDFAANVVVKNMVENGYWKGETYFRNWKTEESIPVSDEHFMIREPKSGRILGMGTVTRDISDIKRAEEQLARLYRETQLAMKTREDVLAVVSHDLKNPVTAISLMARVLLKPERLGTSKITELGERIQRSTAQMQRLISDLLDFAKIESGTLVVEKKPENALDLIHAAYDLLRSQAEAKHQKVELDCPINLPAVIADKHRIGQVLSNILGNAVKFTPDHGFILLKVLQEGEYVRISVSDTGPGITPEELPKVFDQFWQSTKTKGMGSGLGLPIAKGFVEAHGGRIWVESVLGKGVTVHFTVPIFKAEALQRVG